MDLPSASLTELQAWATGIMVRKPDFTIGGDYLRRWYLVPRNAWSNLYLHEIVRSDDDRALHDHPWDNRSFVLFGGYIEHTPEGRIERRPGDVVERAAEALHRLELFQGQRAISLFSTGPKRRDWGFACPQGWVPWWEFTDPSDGSQVGPGCGEP